MIKVQRTHDSRRAPSGQKKHCNFPQFHPLLFLQPTITALPGFWPIAVRHESDVGVFRLVLTVSRRGSADRVSAGKLLWV